MGDLVEAVFKVFDAGILSHHWRDVKFQSLFPIEISSRLLILGISASHDHLGIGELEMEAKPTSDFTDQSYRDRTFVASKAIIHDPSQRGFSRRTLAGNDIDPSGKELNDARIEVGVFRPEDDFEDCQFHLEANVQLG